MLTANAPPVSATGQRDLREENQTLGVAAEEVTTSSKSRVINSLHKLLCSCEKQDSLYVT